MGGPSFGWFFSVPFLEPHSFPEFCPGATSVCPFSGAWGVGVILGLAAGGLPSPCPVFAYLKSMFGFLETDLLSWRQHRCFQPVGLTLLHRVPSWADSVA